MTGIENLTDEDSDDLKEPSTQGKCTTDTEELGIVVPGILIEKHDTMSE